MSKTEALAFDIATLSNASMQQLAVQLVSTAPDRAQCFEYILSTCVEDQKQSLATAKQHAVE